MNGAESVLRTLAASGVEVCFANPGTSEMHLVAAMDRVPEVRGVLCLFEGVASAAADGYARMAGRPAATLLHLGPGFGNAFANVHNAYKGRTPMVNLVGDHAVAHGPLGAPLTSDVEGIARPASHWLRTARDAREAATLAAEAVAAARRGQVATLVLPADAGWEPSLGPASPVHQSSPAQVPDEAVSAAAHALRSGRAALLLGGVTTRERGLRAAARIAAGTGATVFHDTFAPRLARGGSRPRARLLPYLTEMAVDALAEFEQLVVVGTRPPVGFFAYPGKPSLLWNPETSVTVLATAEEDALTALEAVADLVGAEPEPVEPLAEPELPTGGTLDPVTLTAAVAALLPEHAVVVDEAVTASALFQERTAASPEHDYLFLTGGAIGWGLPAATGAAIGAPGRPVYAFEADGSAMYTIQALWTQAREELDVTTIIVANRSYAILEFEFSRVGAEGDGTAAHALMDIGTPELNFAQLAQAQGVPGRRVDDLPGLIDALNEANREPGPHLIEALV
ncbi:acetolactate synthase large subunit [Solirubrobacter sp. CPCC 204708]|uniref:Acetolactate synthase large subunit n=1 Tax=Solirubrobacter deserti TaxID=2282478 RepID=A0ABT4RRC9_9ACTN|nr:acetolactate synthase large subunit [Solirubrobacter deserti]MBE2314877.1 acetolactate synthase large subunit [Solirubrobacter deserti]MDA0141104.1 acetolactate synthase large subunit [Solirubrobacter deserti]